MGKENPTNELFCFLCAIAGVAAGVSAYRRKRRRRQEEERRRVEAAVEELEGWEFEAMRANYLALMDDALAALSTRADVDAGGWS
ncbi:hypothetical protein E2562_017677 [Oryza meyeriana var. granulata]|uniref:Uncharacterized protein n=1 Tax=Oryza meyeriana var. granulata TaxID=110450 RepID=A0A6G1BZ90_9ORYZ|nr:hypothetical protein E2562_017677 [Oryza meyeriana var. granulata]